MSVPETSARGNDAAPALDVPPHDAVADLVGDPCAARLTLFLNGNQFMVLPELLAAFAEEHPGVGPVFYETLPPGVLVEQLRHGRLRLGTLELSVRPDVLAAGPDQLGRLAEEGLVEPPVEYASNMLAMLVGEGNPRGIGGLADLGEPGVRVALPDPRTEGVGRLILTALTKAGGQRLREQVATVKRERGETRFTTIHHRQSARWLRDGEVDAAPLWQTEALHHLRAGAPFAQVTIPAEHNERGRYAIAVVNAAPHPDQARAFVAFMTQTRAREVYRRHGFTTSDAG